MFLAVGCLAVAAITGLYICILLTLGPAVSMSLYPRQIAFGVAPVLALFGAWLLVRGMYDVVFLSAARAVEKTAPIFWAASAGAVFTCFFGLAAVRVYGVQGAATAKLTGSILQAAVFLICLKPWHRLTLKKPR